MATLNTSGAINRITKEIAGIKRGNDISLAVACRDSDVRHTKALIIGPPETPYEYGFFEFDIKFTKEYPIKSPLVRCLTTNGGRSRFNPNIYADGKVCLSILGTWRGERGEEWSSAQGLESILLSIQSLMSSNPYENEPGFEQAKKDEEEPQQYVAKIRHETIRISVIQRLEELLDIVEPTGKGGANSNEINALQTPNGNPFIPPNAPVPYLHGDPTGTSTPSSELSTQEYDAEATFNAMESGNWEPFSDLLKHRFLWYYDTYVKTVTEFASAQKDGSHFHQMPFEYGSNDMQGKFDYKGLRSRLDRVLATLNEETASWATRGVELVTQNTQLASQLAFQFKQLEYQWNQTQYQGSRMEISLPDAQNPFIWHLTLFGRSSTTLEGGIFNMTLSIPPKFPEAQPRVHMATPIYHRQVNSIGVLAYFPNKPEELNSHLQAIVATIDDDNPRYDPRAVINPEAFDLFWGDEGKRKTYNRKMRRSAQESSEY